MTSGRGCTHTERTPTGFRDSGEDGVLHGYQVWVALPQNLQEQAPRFDFVASANVPRWTDGGIDFRLVAGEGYGRRSPLPVHSPLFLMDVGAREAGHFDIAGQLCGEIAVVVVTGEVSVMGADGKREHVGVGEMLISGTEDECCLDLGAGARVLLFGGEPLDGERHLYWNFVSSDRERLERAKRDWRTWWPGQDAGSAFGLGVDGDETYIALPGEEGDRVGEGRLATS